jgi:iron complex outermembrane receptor protein
MRHTLSRGTHSIARALVTLQITLAGAPAGAQTAPIDLARISIEELMNIEIVSASRKEQRVLDTPAAVFVLTQEDIRRSGLTTLPDVLRLVPGVDVAQLNANKWAVSVRGFNAFYANKLLVLIDGRSLYNRLFSGVLWDSETIMLDDIERIEILRGPGGAVWGANAVNGVINIVTKSAADTLGTLARAGGGTSELVSGAVRYGGTIGEAKYRLFSQWSTRGDTTRPAGLTASDASRAFTNGGRFDWSAGRDNIMIEGHAALNEAHALWTEAMAQPVADVSKVLPDASHMESGAVNAQWLRRTDAGATLQLQSSFDMASRREPIGDYQRRAGDVELQYHSRFGARHDLVSGAGFQLVNEGLDGAHGFALHPHRVTESILNVFAQDEIAAIRDRLALTVGTKVERATGAGWGVQPTARAIWTVTRSQRVWTALSRSLRTPSIVDRDMNIEYAALPSGAGLPILPRFVGNAQVVSESVDALEGGYRVALGAIELDATAFGSRYRELRTYEPLAPSVVFTATGPAVIAGTTAGSGLGGRAAGVELSAQWQPFRQWRLDGGYSTFSFTGQLSPTSADPTAAAFDGDAPAHQWQARSRVTLARGTELDAFVARIGSLRQMGVAAYTRVDARVEFKLTHRLSLAIVGQNLIGDAHAEFVGSGSGPIATLVPRSADVRLFWRVP